MAIIIEQFPLYDTLPVGQDVIFTVEESGGLANNPQAKFKATVFVGTNNQNYTNIGTFKVTPNSYLKGIFNLNHILDNYVSPDYSGVDFKTTDNIAESTKDGVVWNDNVNYHSVHGIDKFCLGVNSIKFFEVHFGLEYEQSGTVQDSGLNTISRERIYFNGVIYSDIDRITVDSAYNFGYNLVGNAYVPATSTTNGFLSDMPSIQYARLTDYGTTAFLDSQQNGLNTEVFNITFNAYNASDALLLTNGFNNVASEGGYPSVGTPYNHYSFIRLKYVAIYPANLNVQGWFQSAVAAGMTYYTLCIKEHTACVSHTYRINLIEDDCKGFETVRLCWLNKWGVWDYYTFTKKSVKTLQSNRTTFKQLRGTWNNDKFRLNEPKGGKRNFKVDSVERILINTDFVNDSVSDWFEQLVNSPEVFILNRSVAEPVILTSSSWTKKTQANDQLIQYSFEIERSIDRRTQSSTHSQMIN